jgi:hypothetical protein
VHDLPDECDGGEQHADDYDVFQDCEKLAEGTDKKGIRQEPQRDPCFKQPMPLKICVFISEIPTTCQRAQGEQICRCILKLYWSGRPAFSFRGRFGAVVAHGMISASSRTSCLT